nr:MAG TPA: hypothetical protein [Caudoviricetes sp.]
MAFSHIGLNLCQSGWCEARSARRLVRLLLHSVLLGYVRFCSVMFGFQVGTNLFPRWFQTGTKNPAPGAIF